MGDNIKTDIKNRIKGLDWIYMVQDRDNLRTAVGKAVTSDSSVFLQYGEFLNSLRYYRRLRKGLLHGVSNWY